MQKWNKWILALLLLPMMVHAERSLVTAPVVGRVPVIDGHFQEGEWDDMTRIGNFLNVQTGKFASEQTTVWLGHDFDNIYIALKLDATVLQHAAQMRTRFLAESTGAKGETGRVWDDDHIQLRILPPWAPGGDSPTGHYQLMLNANANRAAWGPKGGHWGSKISAAGSINDGFWTLEIKIPMTAFDRKDRPKPEELKNWKFNIIRFEKHRGEVSSIENIVGLKYENLKGFADLALASDGSIPVIRTPDVTSGDIRNLTVGMNGSGFRGEWESRAGARQYRGKLDLPTGKSEFAMRCNLPSGHYEWHYGITGKEEIYRSPNYQMSSDLRTMALELADATSVRGIEFNGHRCDVAAKVSLTPMIGRNRLVIESGTGTLLLKLNADESAFPMPPWYWEYQDREKWLPAETKEEGGLLRVSGPAAARFRCEFYERGSQLEFPGESVGKLYLPEEGSCGVLWYPAHTPDFEFNKQGKKVELHLWLPEWLEITGAASRQDDESSPLFEWMMRQPKERAAVKHTNIYRLEHTGNHYRIGTDELKIIDPAYETAKSRIDARTRCMVNFRAGTGSAGKHGQVRYMLVIDGRPELPGTFEVEALPKLDGRQPAKGRITLYLRHFDRLNAPEIIDATYETARQAGANEVFIENVYVNPARFNLRSTTFFHCRTPAQFAGEIDIRALIREHPGAKATVTPYINFTYLNRHPEAWTFIDQEFEAIRKRTPYLTGCFFDCEFRPFQQYSDTSPYTLKIFADELGLKEVPNQAAIEKKYLTEWVKFRSRESGKAAGKLKEVANKHGLEFNVYASPNPEVSLKAYSLDVKDVVKGIDFLYTGGAWDADTTVRTRQLCAEAGIRFAASVHVCDNQNTNWKSGVILRRLIISRGGGVLFWYEKGFDGLMLREIARTTKLFAGFEDFFQQGKAEAFAPSGNELSYRRQAPEEFRKKILGDVFFNGTGMVIYTLNGHYLALVINDTEAPASLNVELPGEFTEFYSGKKQRGTTRITAAPSEFAAFYGETAK